MERDDSFLRSDRSRRSWKSAYRKPCQRNAARLRRTGLGPDTYDAIYKAQQGCCAICRVQFDAEHHPARIDRSAGGDVRGLLCPRCRVGISTFRDNLDTLRAAVTYLISNAATEQPRSY